MVASDGVDCSDCDDAAYRPEERQGECVDKDACQVSTVEMCFAIPVFVTQDQQRRLHELMDEIVRAPCNQPVGGVHWPSFVGGRMRWSARDKAVFGDSLPGEVDPSLKPGEEPESDDDVLCMATTARAYVSREERDRHERREKGE